MHAGRQLPDRLSLGGRRTGRAAALVVASVLASAASGCASSRYVGSIGPTGVYANLGYGLTLNLQASELSARWKAIDPASPGDAPVAERPQEVHAPLDVDGDGQLQGRETTRHLRPTLRLLARSSSAAGARIDIDVVILGGAAAQSAPEDVAAGALHEMLGTTTQPGEWVDLRVAPSFHAKTTGGTSAAGAYRLVVIDQVGFQGEAAAQPRRQSVRVLLVAPAITPALSADFDRVVGALSLATQGGPVGRQDRW